MLTKKSIFFFLAFLGILSICTSAKAEFGSESTASQEQVEKEVLAQANTKVTSCDRQDKSDTTLLFNTNNGKTVRVFRTRNTSPQQLLMNIYDSKNRKELAACSPAARLTQPNQITYNTKVQNTIYYATVLINKQSKREGSIIATDQNGKRRLWTEPAAGEVTLKLRISD
ncbi:hypothetical protein [Fischerella thermalis]|uniref:hypothetical protein n=1 Tax=Fischerella thermalis TaxID=372787 RepID=UPI000E0C74E6|nr:hypothetical protein [Fischerella thermalis]RDH50755.1 hypothetical protein CA946_05045 [Fischerella thermalis 111/344/542]